MNECKYEKEIAVLQEIVPRVETKVDNILNILQGTNSEGLLTKLKGMRTQLKIQWWWIAGISVAILGTAFWVIRTGVV